MRIKVKMPTIKLLLVNNICVEHKNSFISVRLSSTYPVTEISLNLEKLHLICKVDLSFLW